MSALEPVISYPPELPVSAAREEISRAIRDHQVVIVAGATGSGKTTQLPKICLELGRERIAHTQPRRIAARTIAERIAEELEVPLGTAVGYKVRFTDKVSADTRVALMTDGILLNEIHRDRLLRRYDTIIVDEAHERSLNVDFLLGYLTRILPERPDLKVIITSATIDPESFAKHFADAAGHPAPIVEVSGRTYPVEIRYRSPVEASAPEDDVDAIVAALRELDLESPGDVLVFLPGEAEIRDAADAVRGAYAKDRSPTEVLPLYGRLSSAEQHRVFERSRVPGVRRRVILATNVAETSLTVPGIRYVIDTGTARISRYSARAKVQRLPIEAVSQASAQQRSGRAGRTSPGIAIRLYSEEDFEKRPEFTEPEILRTSLASVILQMLALGFGDITAFPFLTPPDSRGVKAAFDLLLELGAVESSGARTSVGRVGDEGAPSVGRVGDEGAPSVGRVGDEGAVSRPRLTAIGRQISRLPIDPRFARMLIESERTGARDDVLAIVAGLSIQDVRERPEQRREEADRLHARFTDPTSDFLTLLGLWTRLREQQAELGSSAFRRLCRAEHLNYVRVREWFDVHRQLQSLMGRSKAAAQGEPDPDAIHRAILAGLLSHIGVLDETRAAKDAKSAKAGRVMPEYRGARGIRFAIFPGSGLRKKAPHAVMAAELVETSRLFARTAAAVDLEWAEALAGDLAKRQVTEPHWSKDAGAAVAWEKVTLFGVDIVPRRRIQFARIDREGARELFVRHALVDEDWDSTHLDKRLTAFTRQNHELRRRLEKVEERERRRDILVGDEAVFAFYDSRVPVDVFDARSFEKWWRDALETTPRLLTMRESDLVADDRRADARDFPTRWTQGDQTLSLAYRFEPGAPDDGVTVLVPLALLASLRPDGFDWQVPGLRDELIAGMLRALPKHIRRHVVPAADWASRLSVELAGQGPEHHDGMPGASIADALARLVMRHAHQPVTSADFEFDRVPSHLRVSFRAVDARGREVGSGRDLAELQARLAPKARESVAAAVARPGVPGAATPAAGTPTPVPERTGITTWDLGELPRTIDTKVAGGIVRGYPALVDDGSSASLRIESTPEAADRATRAGVRRLTLLAVPSPVAYVQEHLTSAEKLALATSPYQSTKALFEDSRVAVADELIGRVAPGGIVRSEAEFTAVRDAVSAGMVDGLFACVSLVSTILAKSREVDRRLRAQTSMALLGALRDIRGQLDGLIAPGFVSAFGLERLRRVPRYLDAMLVRLEGLADNPGRDRQRMTEFERALEVFAAAGGRADASPAATPALGRARWQLEELRVSLFAQQLGTPEPVSAQRIIRTLSE